MSEEPVIGDESTALKTGTGLPALHSAVLAALGAGVVVQDPQGRIVEANGAASRILGMTVDQLHGRTSMDPAWAAVHHDGSPFLGETHPSMVCLATGRPVRDVIMGVHKPDGSLTWIVINAEPIPDELAGGPPSVVTAFTEITALQVALDAAARSEARYRVLAEGASEVVAEATPEGVLSWVSPSVTALLGWSPNDVTGRSIFEMVHPDDLSMLIAEQGRIAGGEPASPTLRARTAQGGYRWIHTRVHPVFDDSGRLLSRVAAWRAVESERTETDPERRYRQLAEHASDVVSMVGPDRTTKWVSPSVTAVLGWEPSDVVGTSSLDWVHADDIAGVLAALEHPVNGIATIGEFRHLKADGTYLWVSGRSMQMESDGAPAGRVIALRDVHQQVSARSALRAAEEQYRILAQYASDLVCLSGPDRRLTWVSPSATPVLGWMPDELIGTALADLIHPDDRPLIEEAPARVNSAPSPVGHTRGLVTRFRTSTGEYRWMSGLTTPVVDDEGRLVSVVVGLRDVNELVETQQQLATTATLLERTGEIAHIGGWERDLVTDERVWSSEMFRILEIDPLAISTTPRVIQNYLSPDAQTTLNAAMAHGIATKTGWDLQLPAVTAKGLPIWLRSQGETVVVDDVVVKLRGYVQNITALKSAEEVLRDRAERLRAIFDTEPECVKVVGPSGDLLEMNAAGLRMLEADSVDEARQHSLIQFIIPKDRAAFASLHRRVMAGEDGILEFEVVGLRGTRRRLETHATPMRNASGQVAMLLGITRDVTERRRLEAQLLQAAKTESIGRLAGGIAHDFNNMLTVILVRAEAALAQLHPAEPSRVHLEQIHSAAERSASLTRQLLAYARQQIIEPKAIRPDTAVTRMMPMLHSLIGEDVSLTWSPDRDVWPIMIDPSQFDQILANLMVNARDALAGNVTGTITVRAFNIVIDNDFCATHWNARLGDYVCVAVTDDGIGIDEHAQRNVFEPFFTTKDIGAGTGLGLATVHGIVEQSNGFITITSAPGDGASFEIFLPRHLGPVDTDIDSPTSNSERPNHETILVVEDEPAILELIVRTLEPVGYHVLAASNATDALALAREHAHEHHGQIDLLLSDVVMAGMNGPDLASTLADSGIQSMQLFMSGYPAHLISRHGIVDEDLNFIQKPFTVKALTSKIRNILDTELRVLPAADAQSGPPVAQNEPA